MKRIISFILALMFFAMLAGCSGKTTISFMREDVTLDFVNRICVLPLENNTDKKYAAELARDVINTQIMAMNIFDVIDKGIVDSVLQEEAIIAGSPVNQQMLSRLGQRLNVQAIMVGTVNIAEDRRVGSVIVPQVSMTLRLVEIQSGSVLWQASGNYAGDSVIGRLFGLTPDDTYKVTAKLAKELLSTIPERSDVTSYGVQGQPIAAVTQPAPAPEVVKPQTINSNMVSEEVAAASAPFAVEGVTEKAETVTVEPAVGAEQAAGAAAVPVEEIVEETAVTATTEKNVESGTMADEAAGDESVEVQMDVPQMPIIQQPQDIPATVQP